MKKKLIEDLKKLTELLIWGERNNEDFFEFLPSLKPSYFCESQIMEGLYEIIESIKDREVVIQVIQTLSMLSYNLDLPQHISTFLVNLDYILSHALLNEFIDYEYDFYDDEILDYFISFLKSLALKVNNSTLYLFFKEVFYFFIIENS